MQVWLQPVKSGNTLERVTTTTTTVVTTKTEGQYQLEKFAYDPYTKGKTHKTKQVMGFIEQPWYSQLLTSGDIQVRVAWSAAFMKPHIWHDICCTAFMHVYILLA